MIDWAARGGKNLGGDDRRLRITAPQLSGLLADLSERMRDGAASRWRR